MLTEIMKTHIQTLFLLSSLMTGLGLMLPSPKTSELGAGDRWRPVFQRKLAENMVAAASSRARSTPNLTLA